MIYRAVNDRCLVNFDQLNLPVASHQALDILRCKGFLPEKVDIIELARSVVGRATYRRGARLREAPELYDCSGLTKWLYGEVGVWIPRRSIQQREVGQTIELSDRRPGDLIFTTGRVNRYLNDPEDDVGHVGIIASIDTVIHAANKELGIIESRLTDFLRGCSFRGIRRIADLDRSVVLRFPPKREIETSDDIKWVVLQSLSRL